MHFVLHLFFFAFVVGILFCCKFSTCVVASAHNSIGLFQEGAQIKREMHEKETQLKEFDKQTKELVLQKKSK